MGGGEEGAGILFSVPFRARHNLPRTVPRKKAFIHDHGVKVKWCYLILIKEK